MRILQINTVCGYGSTGRIAVNIGAEVEKKNHECYIAYGHGKTSYQHSYQIGTYIERLWHNFMSRLTGRQALYSSVGTKRFIKWIKELQPDVIHLHNIHGNYLNMRMLFDFLSEYNRPVIWTFHDCWPLTGHCAHFDYIGCQKWKTHCFSCPNTAAYPPCFIDNSSEVFDVKRELFGRLTDLTIVTPSKWLYDLTTESILSKHNKIVIHNGIDVDLFIPVNADELRAKYKNKVVLLGVSSVGFYGTKGLDSFIDLNNRLDSTYQIILIGATPLDKKHLPQNIVAIERTNCIEDLVKYYSLADVFINPTLEDNFPTTNLEAMACGTPVLTFNTGGSAECIGNDPVGMAVEKGNNQQLCDAVLAMNTSYKKQHSLQCRQKTARNFSLIRFVDEYTKLYNI